MSEPTRSFHHRYVAPSGDSAMTLLLLHGTGGDESDLLELGSRVAPAAALLSPRGQVLENGMPRFFRRTAEGVFDVEDLHRRTHELADFVRNACAVYARDPRCVLAVGYSNGANIAASLLLLRPETLAAGVLLRPMVPFVPAALPDLSGKAALVAGGQRDAIVPASETARLAQLLAAAGADVTVHWHRGGHELGDDDDAAARAAVDGFPRTC